MDSFIINLKYALRIFSRRKILPMVVMLTLAIGIGTSTAIFSFVNSVLLEPLPFPDPEQLVIIESIKGGEKGRISQREIADILESTTAFDDAAGYMPEAQYNLTEKGGTGGNPSKYLPAKSFQCSWGKVSEGKRMAKRF